MQSVIHKSQSVRINERLIGWREVRHLTGLSRTGVWRLCREGKFPSPKQLSPNRVGWLKGDVLDWINTRPATISPK